MASMSPQRLEKTLLIIGSWENWPKTWDRKNSVLKG